MLVAGPLIVWSTPFCMSTTPSTFLISAATRGPSSARSLLSSVNSLIWDGLRRVGKIADVVLQNLGKFNVQLRLGLLDPPRVSLPSLR